MKLTDCGKVVDFYFFTGTGNTLLVAEKITSILSKNGFRVSLKRIENKKAEEVDVKNRILGFAIPVASQGTYLFLWEFFKNLPEGKNTYVFFVDTLFMFSGGIVGPLKKLFVNKNYVPLGAVEIRMPSNALPSRIDERKNKKIIKNGLKKAEIFACDLINGKVRWKRIPLFSDIFSLVSKSRRIWKFYSSVIKLQMDRNKCKKCGLCEKLCPLGNISINEYPEFSDNCQLCMRCISFCPQKAIYTKIRKTAGYRAVDSDKILSYD